MGDRVPADERDAAFVPALCDQLDDVYRRFLTANRAAIDDDTREALERSLQLLVAAQAGIQLAWMQARVSRAIRQTNEILATYTEPSVESEPAALPPIADSRRALERLRIVVVALAVALIGAVAAAALFYVQLDSTRNDLHSARQQVAAAQRNLSGVQASLAGANLKADGTQTQLLQAKAEMSRLQAEVARTKSQLSSTASRLNKSKSQTAASASGVQQALSAADAQIRQQINEIQALQLCASNESVVINDELGGNPVAAGQALQVANATCQAAGGG